MKSIKGVRVRYFALVLSLVVIGISVWRLFFTGQGYVKTSAVITSIEENEFSTEEDRQYDVTVRYTVDGKEYTGKLDTYGPSYSVGKTVTILYDPADPSKIQGTSGMMWIFLLLGIGILLIVIVSWVIGGKKQKKLKEDRGGTNGVTYAPSVPGPVRRLYFITDLGTPKYGHRLEDGDHHVLYEAKMTKYTMTQPFGFDFIDYENNKTTPHLIGHMESSDWDSIFIDNHSTFTFDGEFIWKHLKRNGITVNSSLSPDNPLMPQFEIFRDGVQIADAQATGKYVHEEDAEKHGKLANAMPAHGHYRVRTTETNLDLLFVTLLAFARTEATTDEGGNRRTVWNTLKQ